MIVKTIVAVAKAALPIKHLRRLRAQGPRGIEEENEVVLAMTQA
jgi:hypothetical protein